MAYFKAERGAPTASRSSSPLAAPRSFTKSPRAVEKPSCFSSPSAPRKGTGVTYPHFLPLDAPTRVILHEIGSQSDRDIALRDLTTGKCEVLTEGAYPAYSPSGHIVYQTNRYEGGLWALPFSLAILKSSGEAFPVSEHQGAPSVAADETLISIDSFQGETHQLGWRDETGARLELVGQPQTYMRYPALSPDAKRVAVQGEDGRTTIFGSMTLARSIKTRLTFDPGYDGSPKWSPSGDEIAFYSDRGAGRGDVFKRSADGRGEADSLVGSPDPNNPGGWSSDGKYFVFSRQSQQTRLDLLYLERKLAGDGYDEHVFLQTEFAEQRLDYHRTVGFAAYMSNEAGTQFNIYCAFVFRRRRQTAHFPQGRPTTYLSRDGKTLFYVEGRTLIAVPVRPGTASPRASPGRCLNTRASATLRRQTTTSHPTASVSSSSKPASRKKTALHPRRRKLDRRAPHPVD